MIVTINQPLTTPTIDTISYNTNGASTIGNYDIAIIACASPSGNMFNGASWISNYSRGEVVNITNTNQGVDIEVTDVDSNTLRYMVMIKLSSETTFKYLLNSTSIIRDFIDNGSQHIIQIGKINVTDVYQGFSLINFSNGTDENKKLPYGLRCNNGIGMINISGDLYSGYDTLKLIQDALELSNAIPLKSGVTMVDYEYDYIYSKDAWGGMITNYSLYFDGQNLSTGHNTNFIIRDVLLFFLGGIDTRKLTEYTGTRTIKLNFNDVTIMSFKESTYTQQCYTNYLCQKTRLYRCQVLTYKHKEYLDVICDQYILGEIVETAIQTTKSIQSQNINVVFIDNNKYYYPKSQNQVDNPSNIKTNFIKLSSKNLIFNNFQFTFNNNQQIEVVMNAFDNLDRCDSFLDCSFIDNTLNNIEFSSVVDSLKLKPNFTGVDSNNPFSYKIDIVVSVKFIGNTTYDVASGGKLILKNANNEQLFNGLLDENGQKQFQFTICSYRIKSLSQINSMNPVPNLTSYTDLYQVQLNNPLNVTLYKPGYSVLNVDLNIYQSSTINLTLLQPISGQVRLGDLRIQSIKNNLIQE